MRLTMFPRLSTPQHDYFPTDIVNLDYRGANVSLSFSDGKDTFEIVASPSTMEKLLDALRSQEREPRSKR